MTLWNLEHVCLMFNFFGLKYLIFRNSKFDTVSGRMFAHGSLLCETISSFVREMTG